MRTHPSPILLPPRRCVRLWEHVKAVTQREAHVFLIWSHLPKACCQPPSGYVCVSVCALVFVYVSMTRSGWGECLCQCFACTKGKALFLYTHVGETVWCTIVLLLSVPALWSHLFIWLWSLCVHTKQGLCRVRVPCYLLSAWKRAALRKLPLKEPFVSHLKRNLCIRCVTKEF